MKPQGWYCMHRGWMDNTIFGDAEYSEREAWAWLIENAQYSSRAVEINGYCVYLKRGQLSYSFRFLAKAWKWTPSKVERYFQKLKRHSMIKTSSDTGQQIITICNYAKYQDVKHSDETAIKTTALQGRDKSKTNRNKDNNTNKSTKNRPKPDSELLDMMRNAAISSKEEKS